jgi:hypothetical protein
VGRRFQFLKHREALKKNQGSSSKENPVFCGIRGSHFDESTVNVFCRLLKMVFSQRKSVFFNCFIPPRDNVKAIEPKPPFLVI